jgi:polysaccharide export outer membrane protein
VAVLWAAAGGCTSLSTNNLGLDVYEIPQVDSPGLAPVVSAGADGAYVAPLEAPPAELAKVSLPDYRIEPPDILLIEGIRMVPKTPYELQPLDVLQIVVLGTPPEQPIAGQYQVEATGVVNLGPGYGSISVVGLTTDEASEKIRAQLLKTLTTAEVAVSLLQIHAQQILTGEHLVGPDGMVNLGIYGRVYVAGMSLDEARMAIQERLSDQFENPQIALDVFVYNSKFFYIISEGAGLGENVVRIPVTGNETVLDAIATIGGLDQTASTKIWISRPAPSGTGCDQILPVDWNAITRGASPGTNYQLLPGDRLFIAQDRLLALNSFIAKVLNPFERMLGFSLLGAQTIQTMQRFPEGLLIR